MKTFINERIVLGLYFGVFLIINMLSLTFPFFWDNILLGSKVADYFYSTHFQSIFLDPKIDVGHPPFFALYLATMWKLLGRSLIVSHLAMLPVLIGIAYQLFHLSKKFVSGNYFLLALLLFIAEPTFLAQLTMIGPEMVMVFLFLTGLNAILSKKRFLLIVTLIVIPLLNVRGNFLGFTLICVDIILSVLKRDKIAFLKAVLLNGFALLLGFSWYFLHYIKTGWFMSSPLQERSIFELPVLLRNLVVIAFNMLEYGRFIVWFSVLAFVILILKRKNLSFLNITNKTLILVFLTTCCINFFLISLVNNPIGPRYFTVIFILLILVFVYFLQELNFSFIKKMILACFVFICLTTGHLWVYKNISNAWDGTLAHVPYFKAHEKMMDFIQEKLPEDTIGTSFPLLASPKSIYLKNIEFKTKRYDLKKDQYVLYSNISNDFQTQEIDTLKSWKLIHEERNKWIFLKLYERP